MLANILATLLKIENATNLSHDGFHELIVLMETGNPVFYTDDIKTDDVIQLIESNGCFSSLCDYFREVERIEEEA